MEYVLGVALVAFVFWLFVIFPAWVTYDARFTINRHLAPDFWDWFFSDRDE